MVRTFYVQKGKEDIMHKFKETNEKLGLNYSATLVELMQKFNKEHSKKAKDGSNK
jgi:hypothetical protein